MNAWKFGHVTRPQRVNECFSTRFFKNYEKNPLEYLTVKKMLPVSLMMPSTIDGATHVEMKMLMAIYINPQQYQDNTRHISLCNIISSISIKTN